MNKEMKEKMLEMAEEYAVECRGYDFKYDNVPIAKAISTCFIKGFESAAEIYEAKLEKLYLKLANTIYECGVDHEVIPAMIKELKELE